MKGILVILLTFNLVSAEGAVVTPPVAQTQSYEENGVVYYKSQKVEALSLGEPAEAHNETQKDVTTDKRSYAERKDFVNNEQQTSSPYFQQDTRPYAERKDFVSLQEGQSNPSIEWIVGKTTTDITYMVVSNELVAYKTTTYLIALKPKALEQTQQSSLYNV